MKRRITTCIFAFCLLGALHAQAQETPQAPAAQKQEQRTKTLEPVVVTAGRVAEKPTTVTQAMTVIPREELEKHQYWDMGDLLRNYGIQVDASSSGNEANTNISMRGMRTQLFGAALKGGVLVLVDGRNAGTANISMMPLVNVERIEILRGPAAVQYGSSAIGGVINVITRRGAEIPKLSAEGGYGSWDTVRALGEASWAYGPFDFSGGVSYLSTQDYQSNTFKRYQNTGMGSLVSYSLNAGLSFLEEHRIGVTLHGVEGQRMGSPYYYNVPDQATREAYTNRYNRSLDLTYDGGYKDAGLSWKGRYYFGSLHNYWDDPALTRSTQTSNNFAEQTNYQGAQGQLSFTKGFLTLTGGLDWQKYDVGGYSNYYDSRAWPPGGVQSDSSAAFDVLGGFVLAKLAFFDDLLIISGGLRHDKYVVKASDNLTPRRSREFVHTSPSVGVAVNPSKWLTLRANYGESYQVPGHRELLGYNSTWGTYIGNSGLKPERGLGWDAGFDVHYNSLNLGVTYFSTDYRDKILIRPVPGSLDQQYYNAGGIAYYRGIEAQAGYDLGEAFAWPFMLRPYVNLTHLLEHRGQDTHHNYRDVPNVSDTTVAYGVQFKHPDIGLNVDLRATYYGYRQEPRFSATDPVTYKTPIKRTGGETIVDLFATQTLYKWEGAGTLSLKGEIRNLFNAKHEMVIDYRMPGRSFWLGLRYDY
ncbi:MAG: TonB-dependent receptor [Deltaproteobacteria bacterium]|jgi:vitamin B12 transporter|nr:TonB-dependent receptor [Deltaproteobacteria bacterium]